MEGLYLSDYGNMKCKYTCGEETKAKSGLCYQHYVTVHQRNKRNAQRLQKDIEEIKRRYELK